MTVPPPGRRTTAPNIAVEADDLEFALGAARGWPFADAAKAGAIGFSSSTLGLLFLAFQSRAISAIVALEGWEGRSAGVDIVRAHPRFDPVTFRAAYLLMGKPVEDAPPFNESSVFLDSIRMAPRWRITFDGASHGDFLFFPAAPRSRAFVRSNEYTLAFLRAQLQTGAASWLPTPEPWIRQTTFAAPSGTSRD
jgi:hypothetical protein